MNVTQIIAKLRQMYPGRIWKYESPSQPGRCQQMNWNVVYILLGYTRDSQMITYPSATAAYNASKIESKDPSKAQPGDIHFWAQPHPWGHTSVEVGNGTSLMASGRVGGSDGLGTIKTAEYTRATGATYLGWSKAVGKNPSIRGRITPVGASSTTPVAKKSQSEVVGSVLTNADTVIKAAKDAGLDLSVAAAVIEKESRGKNIFGHDRGGAYYGAGEVTEAKYKDFIKQVRGGKTSNGVGPAQITWPGFFTDMEKLGFKPWVPYDNMKYGFMLMKSYLNGSLSDAAIRQAGKRYNGNASYGDDLLAKVKQWRTRLGSGSAASSSATPRVGWEASDFGIGTNATKAQWKTIQSWLKKLGRYSGAVDGVPGRNTWKGIQLTVKKYKLYNGPIDGEPGRMTAIGMQKYAKNGGGYRGPVDGKLGPLSWRGFVKRVSS